jgi:nucleoside-diphosphate-sugar epimerase
MKNVLVTGASGFVGTHLLEALSGQGISTRALYFSNPPPDAPLTNQSSIDWTRVDLLSDDLDRHLAGMDVVFHLAGYAGLATDVATKLRLERVNVLATERLAAAALRAGSKLVFTSSIHACDGGPGQRIVDEEHGSPATEYGRSKMKAEELLQTYGEQGLDFTVLRPTQLFGEYHEGSVLQLVRAVRRGAFFLIGDGMNATTFYYVKDFVDTLVRVAVNPICRNRIYVDSDAPLPLKSLVEEIAQNLDVPPPTFRIPRSLGMAIGATCDVVSTALKVGLPLSVQRVRAMTRDVQYSNKRLLADVGPGMRYGICSGLGRTIAWYRVAGLI